MAAARDRRVRPGFALYFSVEARPNSVKIAVLPLSAVSPSVTLDLTIRAEGGLAGIPRDTLNLVVLEGLRQLGITDVHVEEE